MQLGVSSNCLCSETEGIQGWPPAAASDWRILRRDLQHPPVNPACLLPPEATARVHRSV